MAEALANAAVVVDVANSPSFEDQAAMDFFHTAGGNLTAAEVGADHLRDSGYRTVLGPKRQAFMNASKSALIVSACVVGMPCGKPL